MLTAPEPTDTRQMAGAVSTLSTAMRVGQLITAKMLERTLEASFEAPASSGIWDWRCTYDAMEAVSTHAMLLDASVPELAALSAAATNELSQRHTMVGARYCGWMARTHDAHKIKITS